MLTLLVAAACLLSPGLSAQTATPSLPKAELVNAPTLRLPGEIDSNSPVVWERVGGRDQIFVITSVDGLPRTSTGRRLDLLSAPRPAVIDPWPGGGVWMEAVIADVGGAWYGYHHNEMVADLCDATDKMIPRIGAARSVDRGQTWEPLGVILEAPPNSHACGTTNQYFVGGVGDFSVQLDPQSLDLYFFYSQYLRWPRLQGIGIARLAWADRDDPTGRMMVWNGRTWVPASARFTADGAGGWRYPAGFPVFKAGDSWHDGNALVDAFWGPSVHWNTYLQQYVMLLNRAKDASFGQEGIYVSYAPRLDDPRLWSAPVKVLDGGLWYPQVIGTETATGTDKVAGQTARLFVQGVSRHLIQFRR